MLGGTMPQHSPVALQQILAQLKSLKLVSNAPEG
jgi:hypothetical protein